jgi:hypothetical protein
MGQALWCNQYFELQHGLGYSLKHLLLLVVIVVPIMVDVLMVSIFMKRYYWW